MSLSDLAAIGSFISGVAVVVSFIFLALQMRQNTNQMQMAEMNATQTRFTRFRLAIASNRDLAQLWAIGMADGSLDDVDELRFRNLLSDYCWSVFHGWDRRNRGGISEDHPSAIPYLATLLASKRGNKLWQTFRLGFPASFSQTVDEAIVAAGRSPAAAP